MALSLAFIPYILKYLLCQHLGTLLVFILTLLVVLHFFKTRSHEKPLPPGPWGVPILGFIPFLGWQPMHKMLFNLAKKYGSVLRLRLGRKNIVILSGIDVIREAFWRDEMTGRPSGGNYDMFQGFGVINVSGDRWRKQRKFIQTKLRAMGARAFGSKRDIMERKIKSEIKLMIDAFSELKNKPVYLEGYLTIAAANIVCQITMSKRFSQDNPLFQRMMQLHMEGFKLFMKAEIVSYIPVARHLSSIKECIKTIKANMNESLSLLGPFLKQKRETFDPENINDLLDAYLYEEYVENLEGKKSEFGENLDQQVLQVMLDLFSAGEETVKETLKWCFLYLLHHPNVLTKFKAEMDKVVGRSRMPSLEDRPAMPYTEATINEILRVASIVPLGTPHASTEDITIRGFLIPKGTTVFANIFSCHMDPATWQDPDKFIPERFIDEDGKCVKRPGFLPFGVGKRMCLGEMLARNEIFLFVTSILHAFDIESVGELPNLEGEFKLHYASKPYMVRLSEREFDQEFTNETFERSLPTYARG